MTLGFTGSRTGMTLAQKAKVAELIAIYQPDRAVHGDCVGADADFHELARAGGVVHIRCRPANLPRQRAWTNCDECATPEPPLMRNHKIIADADMVFATPDTEKEQLRSGTWATIRYAKKWGATLCIIHPDGSTEWWAVP